MHKARGWLALAFFVAGISSNAQTAPIFSETTAKADFDGDHDGLSDSLEGRLIEQFRPSFMVSRDDCDQLPAEMVSGEAVPHVFVRNGTIYGQATPRTRDEVELHYFHLWSRDCGRRGHRADVEHVSALIRQEKDGAWRANYWYAAAHEDTVCDRSMFAAAPELQAVDKGPEVWISAGKHASYFSAALCNGGCGGDSCRNMRGAPLLPVINLGEPGAPLGGAAWTSSSSSAWSLAAKMSSDFDAAMIAQLESRSIKGPVRMTSTRPGMQRAIAVSNTTVGGLDTAEAHTGNGLETARTKTSNALQRSYGAVQRWIRHNSTQP